MNIVEQVQQKLKAEIQDAVVKAGLAEKQNFQKFY